jgi:hypothetical protein
VLVQNQRGYRLCTGGGLIRKLMMVRVKNGQLIYSTVKARINEKIELVRQGDMLRCLDDHNYSSTQLNLNSPSNTWNEIIIY